MRGVFWKWSHWPRTSFILRDLSGPRRALTVVVPSATRTLGFTMLIWAMR